MTVITLTTAEFLVSLALVAVASIFAYDLFWTKARTDDQAADHFAREHATRRGVAASYFVLIIIIVVLGYYLFMLSK